MTIMDSTWTGTLSFHHIICEILLGTSSETKRCLSCKKHRKSIFNNNDFHHVKNGLNPWYAGIMNIKLYGIVLFWTRS